MTEPAHDPPLTVRAVAARLGIAPGTLRSWHRRYGIGPSEHVGGRHRRYGPLDVARLDLMHAALVRGLPPADAARSALAAGEPGSAAPRARAGGRALPLPGAAPPARGLARAASSLDPETVRRVVTRSIAQHGVVTTWDAVARPVLGAIGERWARTGTGVEVEHLLSHCLIGVFGAHPQRPVPVRGSRPVLLAAAPDEQHSLPLHALSAALAERGVAHHLLGAALPLEALHAAVRRVDPASVVLWAHAPPALPRDAPLFRPRSGRRWYVGGPGWAGRDLPDTATALPSLQAAVDEIARHLVPVPH